jgi:uracil-DNA glycosylase family 4
MFVGENPSWADHQQTPFSETTISGRALRRYYLEPLGLRESDVWITDLFKCRYPKKVHRAKRSNASLIQHVASTCARRWLVCELALAQPDVVVTLADKAAYQRLRVAFGWNTPRLFADAVGRPHNVRIERIAATVFPMVHPDISRPIGDGDNRKQKTRAKWAILHLERHIPALRAVLTGGAKAHD